MVGPRLLRMRRPLAVVILAAFVVTACGSGSATGPSPSGSQAANGHGILVARANDGGIVHARVGDRVQIALGADLEWRLDPPDGIILVRGEQNYLLVRGTQAIWTAASTGTSIVTATGSVICPSGKACILVAVLFRATVIVEP